MSGNTAAAEYQPIPPAKRCNKHQARCRYVCIQCRTQRPDAPGSVATPILSIITIFAYGPGASRHRRKVAAAEGVVFRDGQVALQWNEAGAEVARVETFPSMRAVAARYGARFEVIRREW